MTKKEAKTGKHSRDAVDKPAEENVDFQQTSVMDAVTSDDADTAGSPAQTAQGGFVATNPAQPYAANGFEGGVPGWTAAGEEGAKKPRDMKKVGKIIGIIVGVILAVYVIGVVVFSNFCYPNSTLGGTDVSLKSKSDLAALAESKGGSYSISVQGDGMNFNVSADQVGLKVDGSEVANAALAGNKAYLWPYELSQKHDETDYLVAEYNSNGLETLIKQKVEQFNATATDPVNATIAYAETTKAFAVKAEQAGTKLDLSKVLAAVDAAVMSMDSTVTLGSDELVQPTVFQDDPALATAATKANAYVKADLTLVMGDSNVKAAEISGKQIAQWVVLDANKNVTFDTAAMTTWVQQLVDGLNTVGSTRTYTRPDGKAVTVTGGTYGWDIDGDTLVQQVTDGITNGTVATITVPTNTEGVTFTAAGARDWGLYVDVDITEQHARCYDASNNLLWEADIVTGTPDGTHETPEGVWRIYNKQSPSVLKGDIVQTTGQPEWECTVQFWMAFTPSGCGLHDAYWQSAFGGSRYLNGYGSHGCVNLSYSTAQALYDIVSVGNAVVVHY